MACNPFCLSHHPPLLPTTAAASATSFTLLPAVSFLPRLPILHKLCTNKFNLSLPLTRLQEQPTFGGGGSSSNNNNNNNRGGGGGGGRGHGWNSNFFNFNKYPYFLFPFYLKFETESHQFSTAVQELISLLLISASASISYFIFSCSQVQAKTIDDGELVCEIRGGKKVELVPDYTKDEFVVPKTIWPWDWGSRGKKTTALSYEDVWMKCRDLVFGLMLPEGFPDSVTSDYLEYSLWRGVQGIAAQISGVLATQSLLYAVGLGKGAIPTAAAVNWVLKDGIGYLSKILLSKYGRHFDVNPKSWRLCADLLENIAYGMEILTPAFPHLFVPIGAVAGAGRSAAILIQAATRSCFYAGFAARRNFAEVIAKGEAQGMVSKSIGIMLGIGLASCAQSSTPLALASFGVVTWIHMYCNLKSYQSIQLRTLNPYRASLVFSEYLLSGLVPSIKEVNAEEPLFPGFRLLNVKPASEGQAELLSADAKDAAAHIEFRLQLGSKLSDVVKSREDAVALFELYKNEGYILTELEGRYHVVLKESSTPQDMLKSLFQVSYLYWLEKIAGIRSSCTSDDCRPGGRLQLSLDYVLREFTHVKNDSGFAGWVVDGLIARPLPNRVSIRNEGASPHAVH